MLLNTILKSLQSTLKQLAYFLFFFSSFNQIKAAPIDTTIYYQIKPIQLLDRTNLEITLRFKVTSDTAVQINLPVDYYGLPNLYKSVTSFEVLEGALQGNNLDHQRTIKVGAKKQIEVRYLLSYDPLLMDTYSFGPNISNQHFHVAGCQWMLQIGDLKRKNNYHITIVNGPKKWNYYSSMSKKSKQIIISNKRYTDLISTMIGGGEQPYMKFSIHGRPLYVFIKGNYSIPYQDIFAAVKKIVLLQREWFVDHEFPFYTVTIQPRSGIIAGTCVSNLFVCFVKNDISRDQLYGIISHEMFHNWLPGKIRISAENAGLKYEWFNEGIADYLSRKILFDAGLVTQEKFVEYINNDIFNIADNMHRDEDFAQIMQAAKTGKYDISYKKLSYYRGALIAFRWDVQMEKSYLKFRDFMKELYLLAKANDGNITEQNLFEMGEKYKLGIAKDINEYIKKGRKIEQPISVFGKFKLMPDSMPSFSPGFSLMETFRTRKISNVVDGSNACQAGLRNGLDFIAIENSNRFANGWDLDKPIVVTVKENGVQKKISYFPRGNPLTLKLYR